MFEETADMICIEIKRSAAYETLQVLGKVVRYLL